MIFEVTPSFITEALCFVTYVQLLMTDKAGLACGWYASSFLKLLLSTTCVCMCMCVCPESINNHWYDIWTPYDWLNKFYSFYLVAVVSIISRRGLRIDGHCRNQLNKSKLVMYKLLIHFHLHTITLKQSKNCALMT